MIFKKKPKTHISITGMLVKSLRLGHPAVYLYRGELIRTTAVQAILEATPERVCFETKNSIYELSNDTFPEETLNAA